MVPDLFELALVPRVTGQLLRAGSSAEESQAGRSSTKGGASATGNSGCSGTEEKIVGGRGGPSGFSRKFRTLEGSKKKKIQ